MRRRHDGPNDDTARTGRGRRRPGPCAVRATEGDGLRLRAFLLGLVAGALGGVLLVEFGIGLPFLAALAIALGCAARPRPMGAAGTLIGWGATWIAVLASAAHACAVDQTCGDSPPSVAPWIVAGLGLVLAGSVLVLSSDRRRPAP